MRKLTMAALIVSAWSGNVQAAELKNPVTGNGLLSDCDDSSDSYSQGLCNGYILGVARLGGRRGNHCVPAHATNRQVYDVVKNGLRSHPEERQKESNDLILKYLHAAFPCAKGD